MNKTEQPEDQIPKSAEKLKQELKIQAEVEGLPDSPPKANESTTRHAFLVGAGILISRIIGVLRQRIFAYYFGTSAAADIFNAAFRIPNFLQNVFGEGALSASLIPVYAGLLAKKNEEEANRVANAVLTLLALITSLLVLLGVLLTPYLISFIAPALKAKSAR